MLTTFCFELGRRRRFWRCRDGIVVARCATCRFAAAFVAALAGRVGLATAGLAAGLDEVIGAVMAVVEHAAV